MDSRVLVGTWVYKDMSVVMRYSWSWLATVSFHHLTLFYISFCWACYRFAGRLINPPGISIPAFPLLTTCTVEVFFISSRVHYHRVWLHLILYIVCRLKYSMISTINCVCCICQDHLLHVCVCCQLYWGEGTAFLVCAIVLVSLLFLVTGVGWGFYLHLCPGSVPHLELHLKLETLQTLLHSPHNTGVG